MTVRAGVAVAAALCAGLIIALQAGSTAQTTQREIGARAASLAALDGQVADLRRQVLTLERANQELEESLSRLKRRVDGLVKPSDGPGSPGRAGDEDPPRSSAEWIRFREDVLRVVQPELQPLRAALKTLERHRHEYGTSSGGWMKLEDVTRCDACLVRATSFSSHGSSSTALTGPPKP